MDTGGNDDDRAAGPSDGSPSLERQRREEDRKRLAREVARRRASHFATFGGSEDPQTSGADSVQVGGDSARTLGPWNTAYQLADAKRDAKRKREESLLANRRESDSVRACYASWTPRKKVARSSRIPTLKSQARELCASLIAHVSTLGGVPDDVRADLAWEVCRIRKMTDDVFMKLFTADAGSSISIDDCSLIEEDTMRSALREAIHPGLNELRLDLCGRGFTDKVTRGLAHEDDVTFAGLEKLVLGGAYRLTDDGAEHLLKLAPALRTLGLQNCSRIEGRVVHCLPELTPKLTSLDLSFCGGIPRESLRSALAKLDQLDSLTLDGIAEVDDELLAAEDVLHGIRNVGVLSLRNTKLTDVGLRRLAASLRTLHSISLDYCTITSSGVIDMVDACPGLTSVSLKKCTMVGDAAVVHLMGKVDLEKLVLNGIGKGLTGASVEAIVCGRGRSLTELDLSWCRHVPERAIGYLIESLPNLKTIKLFGCNQLRKDFASVVRNDDVAIIGLDAVCEDPLAQMAARGRRIVR